MSVEMLEAPVNVSPGRRRWPVARFVVVAVGLVAASLAAFVVAGRPALVTALRQAHERVTARTDEVQRRIAALSAERDALLDAVAH